MNNKFLQKVLRSGFVDTKTYRYIVAYVNADVQHVEIKRLPLNKLGTTAALSEWETVKVIR